MYWTDGSSYQGEWIKGIQHGYGKMIFPDGTRKEGYFENNVYKLAVKISDENEAIVENPSKQESSRKH
jgi:hypothetical protein